MGNKLNWGKGNVNVKMSLMLTRVRKEMSGGSAKFWEIKLQMWVEPNC